MDQVKNLVNSATSSANPQAGQPGGPSTNQEHGQQGSGFGGIGNFVNESLGGGEKGEAKEDYLDKAVDLVQEKVLGQGDQSNESAAEQFKDEQISDAIRGAYKNATGSEFPIADKS